MQVALDWKKGLNFRGKGLSSGFSVDVDADSSVGGTEEGLRPMELVALGLGACTGMDVISILQKKRQDVKALQVKVTTQAAKEHPKVWTHVLIEFLITGNDIEDAAVERAIQLSYDKYCPAQNMIKMAVQIDTDYEIIAL